MQLEGGLDRVMARGEWESLFERVSPELLPPRTGYRDYADSG
ncbi:hypothetical protein O5275_13905 [Escherichia coli]|nr:hypothetical protein [Escherichia coli]